MMALNEMSFGERNFGQADLGDKRRTRRLVKVADQMVHRVRVARFRRKINSPNELKAMYRLLDNPSVTHEAILASHQRNLFGIDPT